MLTTLLTVSGCVCVCAHLSLLPLWMPLIGYHLDWNPCATEVVSHSLLTYFVSLFLSFFFFSKLVRRIHFRSLTVPKMLQITNKCNQVYIVQQLLNSYFPWWSYARMPLSFITLCVFYVIEDIIKQIIYNSCFQEKQAKSIWRIKFCIILDTNVNLKQTTYI